MKKIYVKPELELIEFNVSTEITTSLYGFDFLLSEDLDIDWSIVN